MKGQIQLLGQVLFFRTLELFKLVQIMCHNLGQLLPRLHFFTFFCTFFLHPPLLKLHSNMANFSHSCTTMVVFVFTIVAFINFICLNLCQYFVGGKFIHFFVLFPWSYCRFHLYVQLSSSFSLSTFQAICVVCNNNMNINVGQWWNFSKKLDFFFLIFPCFLAFLKKIYFLHYLGVLFLFFVLYFLKKGYHQRSWAPSWKKLK